MDDLSSRAAYGRPMTRVARRRPFGLAISRRAAKRLCVVMPLVARLVALTPDAGGAGDTVVATVPDVGHLTAYGGVTAWLHTEGDQGRVSYMRGGVIRDVPGDFPGAHPDLGPSRNGRGVVLVLSRCGPNRCVVTSTDTRTGRTGRVHGLGGLRCAGLSSPSTWRGTIVVVGERCGRKAVDGLYVRDRAGRTRRLMRLASGSFSETDVDGTHAVVNDTGDSSVRVVALRTGRSRMVWQGEESASFSDAPRSPALDGGIVVWLENSGGIGLQFKQWLGVAAATVRPGTACERQEMSSISSAIALDDGRLLYATAGGILRQAGIVRCVAAAGRGSHEPRVP